MQSQWEKPKTLRKTERPRVGKRQRKTVWEEATVGAGEGETHWICVGAKLPSGAT